MTMNGKRLYRSKTDKQVAGVAAGLAAYLGLDVTLVRLGFVFLTLLGGPGLMLYVVMWLVMPEGEPDEAYTAFDDAGDVVEMPNITTVDRDF